MLGHSINQSIINMEIINMESSSSSTEQSPKQRQRNGRAKKRRQQKKRRVCDHHNTSEGQRRLLDLCTRFDALKKQDPSLTVTKFADDNGIKYNTLVKYLSRDPTKRKKIEAKGQRKTIPDDQLRSLCESIVSDNPVAETQGQGYQLYQSTGKLLILSNLLL